MRVLGFTKDRSETLSEDEVRAELIKDTERGQIETQYLRDSERKGE